MFWLVKAEHDYDETKYEDDLYLLSDTEEALFEKFAKMTGSTYICSEGWWFDHKSEIGVNVPETFSENGMSLTVSRILQFDTDDEKKLYHAYNRYTWEQMDRDERKLIVPTPRKCDFPITNLYDVYEADEAA
jgi:hypothetical protein